MWKAKQGTNGRIFSCSFHPKSSIFLYPSAPSWMNVSGESVAEIDRMIEEHPAALEENFVKNALPIERLGPKHLVRNPVLRLTNRCNLQCSHCYQASNISMRHGKRDLTLEDVKSFISFIEELSRTNEWPIETVQLFGGETSLNPEFLGILEFLASREFRGIRVSTNGVPKVLRSREIEPYIVQQNIEWRIALESHVPEYQNKIRPVNSYDRVVETIDRFTSKGANVSVKAVLTNENLAHLHSTLEFLRDKTVKQYSYNVLSLIGNASQGKMPGAIDHLDAVVAIDSILRKDVTLASMLHATPFGRWLKLVYGADFRVYPRVQYYIDADGGIYPNDTVYEMDKFRVGDLSSVREALPVLLKAQKELETEKASCLECPIEPFCFRGNYGGLYSGDPSLRGDFPECQGMREAVAYIMQLGERGRDYTRAMYGLPIGGASANSEAIPANRC